MTTDNLTLAILREALTGEKAVIDAASDRDKAEVFILSKKHDLAHMSGAVLLSRGGSLPDKLRAAFETEAGKALYRYTRLWGTFEKVKVLFEENGVDYLPLKGARLRHLYPKAEMRTSCDVDILVKENDLSRATALLEEKLGFQKDGETYHDVSLSLGEGIHLELHYNITENDPRTDGLLSSVWEHARRVGETHEYEMSPTYFAFHIISHAYSHFARGGCGIRALMDIWVLRHRTDFDGDGTRALCDSVGLLPFYEGFVALSEAWFSGKEKDELSSLMQDFILRGGIYGTRENRINAGAGQKKSRLRYALSRVFLPMRYLSLSYPILKKHPVLMPFYQVKRWFRIFFGSKRGSALAELSATATLDKGAKEATMLLFDRLGLS